MKRPLLPTLPRRRLLQTGLASGLAWALPQAHACEFFSTTLRITHPWTRATAADATTAIVCMKFDEVLRDDRLIGVETPVATGAEIGGAGAGANADAAAAAEGVFDFPIPAGRVSQLSEFGTFLRLTGLTRPLEIAREYPLKLMFEQSGVVNATLNVDYLVFK